MKNYNSRMNFLPTISALAIKPSIWQNNNLFYDLKGNDLMYKLQNDVLPYNYSNNFGYPHLGRPTDHFQVTPFEAIYVDNEINPHIQLKDEDQGDVAILDNFIKNEVEPWDMFLQNQHVGSQARSNYLYKVHRRARTSIVAGYHVTPMTNDGDYVAETNSEINLRAGQSITLKPGVHFKAGSTDHLKIEYVSCGD